MRPSCRFPTDTMLDIPVSAGRFSNDDNRLTDPWQQHAAPHFNQAGCHDQCSQLLSREGVNGRCLMAQQTLQVTAKAMIGVSRLCVKTTRRLVTAATLRRNSICSGRGKCMRTRAHNAQSN